MLWPKPERSEKTSRTGLEMQSRWPSSARQEGSLKVHRARKSLIVFGRMCSVVHWDLPAHIVLRSGKCVYQAESSHAILSDVRITDLAMLLVLNISPDIQTHAYSLLWPTQSSITGSLSVRFYVYFSLCVVLIYFSQTESPSYPCRPGIYQVRPRTALQ